MQTYELYPLSQIILFYFLLFKQSAGPQDRPDSIQDEGSARVNKRNVDLWTLIIFPNYPVVFSSSSGPPDFWENARKSAGPQDPPDSI